MAKIRKLFEIVEQEQEQEQVEEKEEENELTTYIGLISGTAEWMEFWKQNPDRQEEMLQYVEEKIK